MTLLSRLGMALAGLLVGLGVAVFLRGAYESGFRSFDVRLVVGPGLVAAGLVRMRLQRMLDGRGGDDG